jgi:molecular chaperone DnaJ
MATTKRDYYQVLGADRSASDGEIKKAFRKLARAHPTSAPHDRRPRRKFGRPQRLGVLSDAG